MLCIYCESDTKVTNSRLQKRLNQVWRRRSCMGCGSIITTIEATDFTKSMVVQDTSNIQPLMRDILLLSIYESLRHRKTASADATAITATVISQLIPQAKDGLLTREQLVRTTAQVLGRFDNVAAVHYTAYHPSRA